jgi:hypothetical protein
MGSQEWQKLKSSKELVLRLFQEVLDYFTIDVVKGNKAIFLALLIATITLRWCFAQLPEILDGVILPRSVVKYLRILGSL